MNIQMIIVILSLLFNLLTGGSLAGNWQPIDYGNQTDGTTTTSSGFNMQNPMQMLWFMQMMGGGNINMNKSNWDQIDQTIDLGSGNWQSYGFGQGSSVRIHGSMTNGMYFDFTVKGNTYDQSHQVTSPIEGLTITTSQYSGSDTGYSFSVGPVNWQTALTLFNYATSSMDTAS